MKLGILSDTHNNAANLRVALEALRQEGARVLIHCGDMTGPGIVPLLTGFKVHYVQGNVDADPASIFRAVRALDPACTAGKEFHGEIAGRPMAAIHGDVPDLLDELISSGLYDFVFHGHTHRRRDETIGRTRVINPGALGGLHPESRSVCVLDPASGEARFLDVAD